MRPFVGATEGLVRNDPATHSQTLQNLTLRMPLLFIISLIIPEGFLRKSKKSHHLLETLPSAAKEVVCPVPL